MMFGPSYDEESGSSNVMLSSSLSSGRCTVYRGRKAFLLATLLAISSSSMSAEAFSVLSTRCLSSRSSPTGRISGSHKSGGTLVTWPQSVRKREEEETKGNRRCSGRGRSSSVLLGMTLNTPFPYPVRVAVLGGGNFGLALSTVIGRKGIPTTLLVRSEEVAQSLNTHHRHPRYMSDLELPKTIYATTDPAEALLDATYIIHSVPVQFSRDFLMSVRDYIPPGVPVLSSSKGIETSSLGFMADILGECLGGEQPLAFLSGPSFAREICEGVATAVVIASEDAHLADDLADLVSSENFRAWTSRDVMGVEIGGAVKNVIALSAGMCEGLGLGTNAMSALVTRACGEMRRLGVALGAKPSTIAGLSGVGDTFGTCFGPLSRNRKFGYRLGKGETMEVILASTTEVAEGVDTSRALVKMIKKRCRGYRLDLKYPILFGVADILEGRSTPREGLQALMNMPMRLESFDEGQIEERRPRNRPRKSSTTTAATVTQDNGATTADIADGNSVEKEQQAAATTLEDDDDDEEEDEDDDDDAATTAVEEAKEEATTNLVDSPSTVASPPPPQQKMM